MARQTCSISQRILASRVALPNQTVMRRTFLGSHGRVTISVSSGRAMRTLQLSVTIMATANRTFFSNVTVLAIVTFSLLMLLARLHQLVRALDTTTKRSLS